MDPEDLDLDTWLALDAKRASVVILQLASDYSKASDGKVALMGKVGTKLLLLASSLECAALPVDSSVRRTAKDILRYLWKAFFAEQGLDDKKLPPLADIQNDLDMRLNHYDYEETRSFVMKLFQELPPHASSLDVLCDRVQNRILAVNAQSVGVVPENANVPEPNGYDESLNKHLCGIIREHTLCYPHLHQITEAPTSITSIVTWHPTRLRLGGPHQSAKWAMFDVVTSSLQSSFWNEFRWFLPTRESADPKGDSDELNNRARKKSIGEKKQRVRFQGYVDEAQYDPPSSTPLSPGYVCGTLDPEETARVELQLVPGIGLVRRDDFSAVEPLLPDAGLNLSSVLVNYGPLTTRDKIVLAHTVAQAFWQMYASDLMQSVWTSETIWFMPKDYAKDSGDSEEKAPDRLPMNAYIAFNSSPHDNVQEWLDPSLWDNKRSATHRFPHILALGVLLLEIGLGKPVGTSKIKGLLGRGEVTRLLSRSKSELGTLKKMGNKEWDGLVAHKACFAGAIEYCLDSKNWTSSQRSATAAPIDASVPTVQANDVEKRASIARRKELLYKNVIRPLAWLAQAFYESRHDVTCAYTLDTLFLPRRLTSVKLEQGPPSELARLLQSEDTSSSWLRFLQFFNYNTQSLIKANQEETEGAGKQGNEMMESYAATFKVAILDTGYNPNMPFFKNAERRERITWKDFVTDTQSSTGTDEYGHGSFMTQLVMESSPLAHVYVIRIAQKVNGFSKNKDAIAKAIRWAGITEKVDIISMSFGLEGDEKSVENITQAIADVDKERSGKVIYFASPSNNSSLQTNMFPARHSSVVAIHATDPMGNFLFNPSTAEVILGTYGKGVSPEILNEITQWYPKNETGFEPKPGSSVATAIASGIAATILAHVAALRWPFRPYPQSPPHNISVPDVLAKLSTRSGMKELMHRMATNSGGNQQRLFLDPIAIWKWASKERVPLSMDWNLLRAVYSDSPP